MESFNLEKSINHTIVYASILLRRQLFSLFRKNHIEITPEQWVVLYYLWLQDGLSLGELAKKTKKDNANITRIINRMEKQSLLRKSNKSNDKRFFYIYLTKEANSIKPSVFESILKSTAISTKGLTEKEQETFLTLLNKIIANMSDTK